MGLSDEPREMFESYHLDASGALSREFSGQDAVLANIANTTHCWRILLEMINQVSPLHLKIHGKTRRFELNITTAFGRAVFGMSETNS